MENNLVGDLSVIGMKGCEEFVSNVDGFLKDWKKSDDTFLVNVECPRFGSGEAKGMVHQSMRGHDVFIFSDMFNYGVTYSIAYGCPY